MLLEPGSAVDTAAAGLRVGWYTGKVSADSLPGQMRMAATSLLAGLDDEQRALAARPFTDDAA